MTFLNEGKELMVEQSTKALQYKEATVDKKDAIIIGL